MSQVSMEITAARGAAMHWVALKRWLSPSLVPLVEELEQKLRGLNDESDCDQILTLQSQIGNLDLRLINEHTQQVIPDGLKAFWERGSRDANSALCSGDTQSAERIYHEIIRSFEPLYSNNFKLVRCWMGLIDVAHQRGTLSDAAEHQRRIAELFASHFGEKHPRYANELCMVAKSLALANEPDQARLVFEHALQLFARTVGVDNFYYGMTQIAFADLLESVGDSDIADRIKSEGSKNLFGWLDLGQSTA